MKRTILLGEQNFNGVALRLLKRYGTVIPFGSKTEFLKNLSNADVLINALDIKLTKDLIVKAPKLKLIGSRTTQLRYIDLAECKKRNIKVINIQTDSPVLCKTPSTAEETMALIFALTRKLPWAFDSIKRQRWERMKYCGTELAGKTVGLIGFGRLGRMVGSYCQAFGTKVVAYDPYVTSPQMKKYKVKKLGLFYLLKIADIVSVHTIYNDHTYQLLTKKHFQRMKRGAYFINTARGEITDEVALLAALQNKWIAGAAVDTLAHESPDGYHLKNNALIRYAKENENLLIVPHLGGTTKEAIKRTQLYITKLVLGEMKGL